MKTTLQTRTQAAPETTPALTPARPGLLQRCGGVKCAPGTCDHRDDERQTLRRKPSGHAAPSAGLPLVADALRSSGSPLDATARDVMGSFFGHDFGRVRVHTDTKAAKSAEAVSAQAYTVGSDVVFGAVQYSPRSSQGRSLLAHELAHVVQQSTGSRMSRSGLEIGPAHDSLEREADRIAADAAGGMRRYQGGLSRGGGSLQRKCKDGGWDFEYDGCSVPPWVQAYFDIENKNNPAGGSDTWFSNDERTGACDRHDECYQTCNPDSGGRKSCDVQMYDNMMSACSNSSENEEMKEVCRFWAETYYTGLSIGGGSAWSERQEQVCNC